MQFRHAYLTDLGMDGKSRAQRGGRGTESSDFIEYLRPSI